MMELIINLKDIVKSELFFIILDVILCSLMAISGILVYGKAKKVSRLILVMVALFLYIGMIFRVLEYLEVFSIKDYKIDNIPIYYMAINYLTSLLMLFSFIAITREK
ncbi:MAG TPA: hypothetical protein PK385_00160 [Spirochaetota bacterium]|nr:MAG: hypothetical protein BWX91_00037 [Spirochaetes bacterium ADurb.Bin133]HNZ25777.1 hypothetical protein [Spirochaetota bacterium]HOF00107.1 hypothetical protein [Spirochaetota bacterium]HOS32353.1 hypothetical protein [Spirochaetota bacterium]HOS54450.1 hypothetical protein [Spirochaetota bacterium]